MFQNVINETQIVELILANPSLLPCCSSSQFYRRIKRTVYSPVAQVEEQMYKL